MKKLIRKFLRILGPGFISGAADDDPTAIAAYSQSGAQFGYRQLWTALFSLPLMVVVQEMSGRIGMVTGKGIAFILKRHYAGWILYFLTFLLSLANIVNIGADLGAIAASAQLLLHVPYFLWLAIFTGIILFLQITIPYPEYVKLLKYTTLALLAYIITSFMVKQNWTSILHSTFIPFLSFKKEYLLSLVAILGTNISPYLFFWQANEEVEEEVEEGKLRNIDTVKPKVTKKEITSMGIDTVAGMFFSQLVVFFIEIAAASTLGTHGITTVDTPTQAAQALKPFAGNFAYLLFLVGIFGSGMLAVPVLAGSTAYVIAEAFGFKAGLNKRFTQAPVFYSTIAAVTVVGILINLLPVKPFALLVYSAALNGFITPVLLVFILLIANNRTIMGRRTNSPLSNVLGVFLAVLMGASALALLLSLKP